MKNESVFRVPLFLSFLFVLDTGMQLVPWLAKSYKNVDPLTWEIALKEGIVF